MSSVSELPTILWMIVRNFFERDSIMDVRSVNYDDTLNLREWKGNNYVDYDTVPIVRNPFTKKTFDKEDNSELRSDGILDINVGDRVVVSFIDGSKDDPVVLGVIQEVK